MSMLVRKGTMLHRNPSRRSSRGRRCSRGSISGSSTTRAKKTGLENGTATVVESTSTASASTSACAGAAGGSGSGNGSGFSGYNKADNKDRDHVGNRSSPNGLRRKSTSEPFSVEIEPPRQEPGSPHVVLNGSSAYLSPRSCAYASRYYEPGSRMMSSSVSATAIQFEDFTGEIQPQRPRSLSHVTPGEDRRRQYRYSKFAYDSLDYGSLMGQIREANEEARSGLDFSNKFFSILCKSAFATTFFVLLAILPVSMGFMGVRNLQECPLQPNLPVYFLVGGVFGLFRVIWFLYEQMKTRRYEHCNASFFEEDSVFGSTAVKATQWVLNGFLVFWFLLGNIWTMGLRGPTGSPPYIPTLQNPKGWCSKQLYLFSLTHLYIIYGLASVFVVIWILSLCVVPIQQRFNK